MNPAEEVEMADEQLAAVYGAWGKEDECYQPKCDYGYYQPKCDYGHYQPGGYYGYFQPIYGYGYSHPRCEEEEKECLEVVFKKSLKRKCEY